MSRIKLTDTSRVFLLAAKSTINVEERMKIFLGKDKDTLLRKVFEDLVWY